MFAEYERARMLERSRRGKRYLAHVGSVSVLSRAPYGYGYVGRGAGGGVARFEVIEAKAPVVRHIFQWVGHERVSLSAVSRRLFEAGVPSPTGNAHWSRSMLWTLLSNPAYAGQAVFGKNTSIPWRPPLRPARGRARVPKRPFRQIPASPEHWVRIAVPAIIEAELFESAPEGSVAKLGAGRESGVAGSRSGRDPKQGGDEGGLSPHIASANVPNLPLSDHPHCLVPGQRSSRGWQAAKAQTGPDQALDAPMVLLNDVV